MSRRRLCRAALYQFIESLENRRLLAAGQLDPSFGAGGKVLVDFHGPSVQAKAVATQSDGKTVIVGLTQDIKNNVIQTQDFAVVRLNFDGSLDTTFGPNHTGIVRTHAGDASAFDGAFAVAIQGDGKIVVAGTDNTVATQSSNIASQMLVLRYNSNGTLDQSFDGDGIAGIDFGFFTVSAAFTMALQSNGKIVVAGFENDRLNTTTRDTGVARLNSNGTLDHTFGDPVIVNHRIVTHTGKTIVGFGDDSDIRAIAIDNNGTAATNPFFGTIAIAGGTSGDTSKFAVARLTGGGVLDSRFDHDGMLTMAFPSQKDAFATGVVVQSAGKLVVSGNMGSLTVHVFTLVRFNSDGSVDKTFGGAGTGVAATGFGGDDLAQSIVLGPSGRLIVGGSADKKTAFAAFTKNGLLDAAFGTAGRVTTDFSGATTSAFGLAYLGDRIVASGGGKFNTARYLDTNPSVAVTAINTTASEQGPAPVTFIVTRDQRLPFTTRVNFSIGGTATSPTIFAVRNHTNDYTLNGMAIPFSILGPPAAPFVDIPADQTFTLVTLTPVDDDIIEPKETATFTIIKTDPFYNVGTPASANLTIADNDQNSVVALNATADAYVRDGASAAMNFGLTTDLQVKKGGSGFNRFSYLKFDISNVTSITSATLEAFGKLSSTANPSVITNAFSVADTSWTETGITFNNAPAAGPDPLASATITGIAGDIFTWDVTSYVKAEKAAGHNTVSFVLKNPNTSDSLVVFNSRQAPQQTPSLVLSAKPVGTFKVATQPSHVAVGQSTNVAVTWTVPSGSWRQLSDIEMRLRGDDGSLVIIDWNESANTLAMFNPATGKFGAPALMGSDNVISNRTLDMLLKTSSTKASGPTSPIVTVTFDLRFNHSAAGHTYTIEVAASNDSGAQTKFGLGGSIHVT